MIARNAFLLSIGLMAGCAPSHSFRRENVLSIKGSDTMLPLTTMWAEEFMRDHPDVTIRAEGGGSETGFDALLDGRVEICAASRPMTGEETAALVDLYRSIAFSVLTARDALCLYTHPENTITSLSMAEVRGIFEGRIRNWSEVRGDDAPIRVFRRNDVSGTQKFFEDHVLLGVPMRVDAVVFPTTQGIVDEISRDPHAIGFGGIGYSMGIKDVRIDNVDAVPENVRNGQYVLSRYLYLYMTRAPRGVAKQFIDWVLSPDGQRIVEMNGYIPLYEVDSAR